MLKIGPTTSIHISANSFNLYFKNLLNRYLDNNDDSYIRHKVGDKSWNSILVLLVCLMCLMHLSVTYSHLCVTKKSLWNCIRLFLWASLKGTCCYILGGKKKKPATEIFSHTEVPFEEGVPSRLPLPSMEFDISKNLYAMAGQTEKKIEKLLES